MEESENIVIGIPEQGGDALNVRLKKDNVDLTIGGCSYGRVQMMVYGSGEADLIAMIDIVKMDPTEAPDDREPYLVVAWDPNNPEVRVERVIDAFYE